MNRMKGKFSDLRSLIYKQEFKFKVKGQGHVIILELPTYHFFNEPTKVHHVQKSNISTPHIPPSNILSQVNFSHRMASVFVVVRLRHRRPLTFTKIYSSKTTEIN